MKRQVMLVLRLVGSVAVLAAGAAASLALADPTDDRSNPATDERSTETSTENTDTEKTDTEKTDTGNTDTENTDTETTTTETTTTETTSSLPTTDTGPSAEATPTSTLDGEIFFANNPADFQVGPCLGTGLGSPMSFTYKVSGTVTSGFYFPGTFSETGKVTFIPDRVSDGAYVGPVSKIEVSFSIHSANGDVTGTKHFSSTRGEGAFCGDPDNPGGDETTFRQFGSDLTYRATIHTAQGACSDQGSALTFFDYHKTNGQFDANSPSLTENFTSTATALSCGKNAEGGHRHHHHHSRNRDNGADDAPRPAPVAAAPGCLTAQGTLDAGHIGPVSLGEQEAAIRLRLGAPNLMRTGFARYCLVGGTSVRFGRFGPNATSSSLGVPANMLLTTSPFYRLDGVGVGSTLGALRASFPAARQRLTLGSEGLWWVGRSTLAAVRDGRVIYLAIYDRSHLTTLGAVRSYLLAAR